MSAERHRLLFALAISLLLIHGSVATLSTFPQNQAIGIGDDATLQCASDEGSNAIRWGYDGSVVISENCASSTSKYTTSSTTLSNGCVLTALGNSTTRISGSYSCTDSSGITAEAVVVVVDPKPTCGVTTYPPIEGRNVTLSCNMTYYRFAENYHYNPRLLVWGAIDWEPGAGTVIGNSSMNLAENVGETLTVDSVLVAQATVIPPLNCTSSFYFRPSSTPSVNEQAMNTLTYSCVTQPVLVWYCPRFVNITPSGGELKAGDALTCSSDGYPTPRYTWTDETGADLGTGRTIVLPSGFFNRTCSATGNFTTPCSTSFSVTGNATGTATTPITTTTPTTTMLTTTPVPTTTPVTTVGTTTTIPPTTNTFTGTYPTTPTTPTTTTVYVSTVADNSTTPATTPSNDLIRNIAIGVSIASFFLALLIALFYMCWALLTRRRRKDEDEEEPPKEEPQGQPQYSIAFYQGVFSRPPPSRRVGDWSKAPNPPRAYNNGIYTRFQGSAAPNRVSRWRNNYQ